MKIEEKSIEEGFESNGYPHRVITEDGVEVFIRPVRPDDADMLRALFKSLSPQSIYFRFFAPIKDFPDHILERFVRINEDYEIALTALDQCGKMLGMACVVILKDRIHAEFGILVGDAWQGKGVGAELLLRCLILAKRKQVHVVWGKVLPENTKMLALGQKLGFTKKRASDANEYELTIDLRSLHV
ncbi:MAG TPA: GNAT family N-acetyltransferase [Deltaproteobacteria bacterium]|nr:GNAT family N-acetyltransferase [Deltaproteobacteria bacterium]